MKETVFGAVLFEPTVAVEMFRDVTILVIAAAELVRSIVSATKTFERVLPEPAAFCTGTLDLDPAGIVRRIVKNESGTIAPTRPARK